MPYSGFRQWYSYSLPDDVSFGDMNQYATGQCDNTLSAAIGAWNAIEHKVHQTFAETHYKLHQVHQDFLNFLTEYLQPLDVPTPTVAVCETTVKEEKVLSCSGCAKTGMTWFAQCARQAMKDEGIDSTLLEIATDPRQVAKAYEAVMAASPSSAKVAHLLRDLLVLTVCTNDGPWTNASVETAMNEGFGRPVRDMDNDFMAKVLLAYNTMHRAAQNSQVFERAVKTLANSLCKKIRDDLLAAYILLYKKTPHWMSRARRQRGNRPAKTPKSPDPGNKQLALDLADLRGTARKLD